VTSLKDEYPDETVAALAAKITAITMWNDCPREYKTVRELSREQLDELKSRHYAEMHGADVSIGDLMGIDELISDSEIFEEYKDDNFTDDDFFCSGGQDDE
jgi:hypothetical protein